MPALDPDAWPIPSFEIDSDYVIESVSVESVQLFGKFTNFLDLVDPESRDKAQRLLRPTSQLSSLELNLLDTQGRLQLCSVRQSWNHETGRGRIVCWPKDERAKEVADRLRQLQEQIQQGITVRRSDDRSLRTPDCTSREAMTHVSNLRDLLHILRPTLLDVDKAAYVELLETELLKLERLLT